MKIARSFLPALILASVVFIQADNSDQKKNISNKWVALASTIYRQHKQPLLLGKKFHQASHSKKFFDFPLENPLVLPDTIQTIKNKISIELHDAASFHTFFSLMVILPLISIFDTLDSSFGLRILVALTPAAVAELWSKVAKDQNKKLENLYQQLGQAIINRITKNQQP